MRMEGLRLEALDPRLFGPEPRPQAPRAWNTREEAILREHYGKRGGAMICLGLLHGRSLGAIYAHAGALGLKGVHYAPEHPGARRWQTSEAMDAEIRRVYETSPTRNAVRDLARRLMRPRWWISKRAAALGIVSPRFKALEWSPWELELLAAYAHHRLGVIARKLRALGFQRTETAIGVKLKREGLDRRDPDHCTALQLARLLGVDGKTVTRWIAEEGLPAAKRGTARAAQQGGDHWWVELRRLRAWIGGHAQLIDLRKVERYWFIDLVCAP